MLNSKNRINHFIEGLSLWYNFHLVESASLSGSNLRSLHVFFIVLNTTTKGIASEPILHNAMVLFRKIELNFTPKPLDVSPFILWSQSRLLASQETTTYC